MLPSDITFHLVDTPDDVDRFVQWYTQTINSGRAVAVDTETNGLSWWDGPGFTRLVQFGTTETGYAIPVQWYSRLIEWALTLVRQAGNDVVMHNAKFDIHALDADNYTLPRWDQVQDTQVLHHLLEPHKRHGLKLVASNTFGRWAEDGEFFLKEAARTRKINWWDMPVDHILYWGYGVVDTILTARLYEELGRLEDVAYEREMEYTRIMWEAETRGLRIDVPYSVDLKEEWARTSENLALSLKGAGINKPGSNRQVEAALKDMGWAPEYWTETGQAQLDKVVLDELQARGGLLAEVAEQLVEYKRLTKWTSTYLDPFIASGGLVHPSVRTMGAKTGRSSVTGPPLQTLPHTHHIRQAVLPYEDNHVLYAIDYASQEYRILAALSGDPAWLAEYRTGAADPHTLVADELSITRDQAKTFNFAMVYGAGNKTLAAATGLSSGQVKRFLQLYDQRFPGIGTFKNGLEMEGKRQVNAGLDPQVSTIGGRHAVAYPNQLYALTNYKIQGSGADVKKEAACRLDAAGYGDNIMLDMHDEFIFSFPEDDAARMADDCASIMTNTDWFDLDIVAEAEGPFRNWGEAYQ